MKYIVPKIFCALGAIAIFAGVFLSEINITLGDMKESGAIAAAITTTLLLFALLGFKMKAARKKHYFKKLLKSKTVEIVSVILFAVCGLASLFVFNHCIAVWRNTSEIQKNLNIHQLKKMIPEYEDYANRRIKNYEIQLNEAIEFRNNSNTALTNLGFDIYSIEDLNSQKTRKIDKLKQVVYPLYIYGILKININDSIRSFVNMVDSFSPLTAPKNIVTIEKWAKAWEYRLTDFSKYKMKGETAEDFQFETTFGNVHQILTEWQDFDNRKRFPGYFAGIIFLFFMLFPYVFAQRSMKIKKK